MHAYIYSAFLCTQYSTYSENRCIAEAYIGLAPELPERFPQFVWAQKLLMN